MTAALRLSLVGVALAVVLVAIALWWERGAAILLQVGAAIAACF